MKKLDVQTKPLFFLDILRVLRQLTINDILISVQDFTNFDKFSIKGRLRQLESFLAFYSIKTYQVKKRERRYKILILGLQSPRVKIQHPLIEIFPGIKRVANITDHNFTKL